MHSATLHLAGAHPQDTRRLTLTPSLNPNQARIRKTLGATKFATAPMVAVAASNPDPNPDPNPNPGPNPNQVNEEEFLRIMTYKHSFKAEGK